MAKKPFTLKRLLPKGTTNWFTGGKSHVRYQKKDRVRWPGSSDRTRTYTKTQILDLNFKDFKIKE